MSLLEKILWALLISAIALPTLLFSSSYWLNLP